jgi:hypothetical protein
VSAIQKQTIFCHLKLKITQNCLFYIWITVTSKNLQIVIILFCYQLCSCSFFNKELFVKIYTEDLHLWWISAFYAKAALFMDRSQPICFLVITKFYLHIYFLFNIFLKLNIFWQSFLLGSLKPTYQLLFSEFLKIFTYLQFN